ncbi:hypothetical protein AAHC03_013789 [Spirometra sp. Aus1]
MLRRALVLQFCAILGFTLCHTNLPPELQNPDEFLTSQAKLLGVMTHSASEEVQRSTTSKCLPISEPVCSGLPYNHTSMPNGVGLSTQREAARRIADYQPLISIGCSQYLQFFLCTVYFPMCSTNLAASITLRPCRGFCLHVKQHCEPVMRTFSFPWPSDLDCAMLPEDSGDELCIQPQRVNPAENGVLATKANQPSEQQPTCFTRQDAPCLPTCCTSVLYSNKAKGFADSWLLVCGLLGLFCGLLTLATYASNSSRFIYPDRIMIYLAICLLMQSAALMMQPLLGRGRPVCPGSGGTLLPNVTLSQQEWGRLACFLQAALLYYSVSARQVWWILLAVAWFLSAARGWAPEAFLTIAKGFHLCAWLLPLLPALCILLPASPLPHLMSDFNELTGVCCLGNAGRRLHFVLLPELASLVIGTSLSAAAFTTLKRLLKQLRTVGSAKRPPFRCHLLPHLVTGRNSRRLSQRLTKMGVTVGAYVLLMLLVSLCDLYHFSGAASWRRSQLVMAQRPECCRFANGTSTEAETAKCTYGLLLPEPAVELLRLALSQAVALVIGLYIWGNGKTWRWCLVRWWNCARLQGSSSVKETNESTFLNSTCGTLKQDFDFPPNSSRSTNPPRSASACEAEVAGRVISASTPRVNTLHKTWSCPLEDDSYLGVRMTHPQNERALRHWLESAGHLDSLGVSSRPLVYEYAENASTSSLSKPLEGER